MRNQTRPVAALRDIQNRKLKRLVQHAFDNVKFYRDLFRNAGVHPADIKSVEDLDKLPIIDKRHFHEREYLDLLSKGLAGYAGLIPVNTSGSSGQSLKFYIDKGYDRMRKAQYLRPYLANGRRITDRVLRLMNTEMPTKIWFHKLGLMTEQTIYSDSDLDYQINRIQNFKPTILQGFGASLSLLAAKILSQTRNTDFHPAPQRNATV